MNTELDTGPRAMTVEALTAQLWPNGNSLSGPQIHLLADGARSPDIAPLIRFGKLDHTCLFAEPLSPRLRAAAPYLVHLAAGSPQTCELLRRTIDDPLGIFVAAPARVTTQQLRLHFKKILWVQDERGRKLYFRFYDPRVLPVYLPTCTREEREQVFGPAEHCYCIAEGRLLRFARRPGEHSKTPGPE
jgi:hypothetical protein